MNDGSIIIWRLDSRLNTLITLIFDLTFVFLGRDTRVSLYFNLSLMTRMINRIFKFSAFAELYENVFSLLQR